MKLIPIKLAERECALCHSKLPCGSKAYVFRLAGKQEFLCQDCAALLKDDGEEGPPAKGWQRFWNVVDPEPVSQPKNQPQVVQHQIGVGTGFNAGFGATAGNILAQCFFMAVGLAAVVFGLLALLYFHG